MLLLEGSENFPEAEVYRDDLNDMHFYVLPQVPILRRDAGKAVFKFVQYRTLKPMANGDVGAALVFMDVELALTPAQEQALRVKLAEKVKERRGAANPAPVDPNAIILGRPQISKATVTVEVLADSGNLVQKVNNAGKPSIYGNNVVAMSAELNQLGAPIFEAVMKSQGAGGVRVVYDLEFAARLPPVKATGTWNASKFYSFAQTVDFEENFWSEDDFSENISELFINSESRVVDVNPGALVNTDPGVAKLLETVRDTVGRQLDEAVKRNLLEAIPPESRDFSKIRGEDFENIKRTVTTNKISSVSISFHESQVTNVNRVPQTNMQSMVSQGFNWDDYAIEVDTDDPFCRQLNLTIQVNADFENLPIFSVDVSIDYPPWTARHGVQTFSFRKADDIGKFTAFIEDNSTKFKYSYVVNYKGESRVFTSRPLDHEGNDLKINVDELGLWLVDVEVGDMNFEQVSRAVLTLEHPEVEPGVPPVSRFQIDKDNKKFEVKELLLRPAQPYTASIKYSNNTSNTDDGRRYASARLFRLKFVHQEERKTLTLEYNRKKAVKRTHAPQGFIGLLLDELPDKARHFVEIDLDDPFFRVLGIDIATPVDFAKIGLFSTDVMIDYGDAADPQNHRHGEFRLTAAEAGPKRFETFLNASRDIAFQVGFQHHFAADSGWIGEKLTYEIPARQTTDRTLNVDPADDLGFLELQIFPNRIDAGIVEAIDVALTYDDGATFQRADTFRVLPASAPQFWRLRLTRPAQRIWQASFTHHLKNGEQRTTGPIASDASFLPVDDPFEGALDIRAIPLFQPGTVRRVFVDVLYVDEGNGYRREERLDIPGDATEPVALRIALLDPALRAYRHRVTIVTADGQLIQQAPVDGEETLIGVGQGI